MRRIAGWAVALALLAPCVTLAQEPFPERTVTMVVAFPPGGVADISARPVAAALEKIWGQPVVVQNKSGAGGAIGTAFVTQARPDGYTLLMALASVSTLPVADELFNRPAAFRLSQLQPIALVTADPPILVVPADSPYTSLADIVAAAKARPGTITYASSGTYGTYHVATEMFAHEANIKLHHVPYNGGAPALRAILQKEVEIGLLGPSVAAGQISAGKLRALASWGSKRLPLFPDVPPLKELGYDVEYYIWSGVFAPVGMPQTLLTKLRADMKRAITDAAVMNALEAAGSPITYMDAPSFAHFFRDDAERLEAVVRKIGRVD